MIISRALANGQIAFEQKAVGPSIYLDQWVWCELSEDNDMRKRFIRNALSWNCCIMYSIASLMELAQLSDQGQLRALAEVMDSLDFGFVEMDPSRVIALEKQHESRLSQDEQEELEQYEEVDDYLSFVNRLSRNIIQSQQG